MTDNLEVEDEKQITETLELGLTVGCVIRDARKRTRKHIKTIAETLKISNKYLEGIENDDYSKFPGDAYITGFVKNYANYLGLDGEELATQVIKEQFSNRKTHVFNHMGQKVEPLNKKQNTCNKFLNHEDNDFNNMGLLILAGIVLLIVLAFSLLNKDEEVVIAPPAVVEEEASIYGLDYENPFSETTIIDENGEEQIIAYEATTSEDTILDEGEMLELEKARAEESGIVEEVIEEQPIVYGSKYLSNSDLTIDVIEDSWIEVYDRDEKEVVFTGNFEATDKIIVPNRDDIVLKTGNAGGILLVFNGKYLDLIGKVGDVSKYISVSSDDLQDGAYKETTKDKKKRSWFN